MPQLDTLAAAGATGEAPQVATAGGALMGTSRRGAGEAIRQGLVTQALVGVTAVTLGRALSAEQGSAAMAAAVVGGCLVQVDTDMETTPAAAAPARTTVGGTREAASETATPDSEVGVIHFLPAHSN